MRFVTLHLKTVLHVLKDCAKAQEVWNQQPFDRWLEDNLFGETRKFQGVSWPLLFSTACCLIWYAKNQLIFENQGNAHQYFVLQDSYTS